MNYYIDVQKTEIVSEAISSERKIVLPDTVKEIALINVSRPTIDSAEISSKYGVVTLTLSGPSQVTIETSQSYSCDTIAEYAEYEMVQIATKIVIEQIIEAS